jgi:DNA-binding GntR family transcriptional regulator
MPPLTLRQRAYRHLREQLVCGQLRAGTQLSEPELAKQLGMSRTPVREALRQMENEGLLEYEPRFGATVRMPDRDELGDMYAVREALESYAAAEAARSMSPRDIQAVQRAFEEMSGISNEFRRSGKSVLEGDQLRAFIAADLAFHNTIIAASGNRYLSKILDDTRLLVRVFTSTFWQYNEEKLDEAIHFHQRLLTALQNRDSEAARLASAEAMQVARRNALRAWDLQHAD